MTAQTPPRKFTGDEMVVATHNEGKVVELRALFGPLVKKLLNAKSDCNLPAPEETGTTFVENALLKAHYVAQQTGKVAIADDSGICVAALDGAPGVYTADWAELPDGGRDFYVAMEKVHDQMAEKYGSFEAAPKDAYFVSCLAIAWPDGHAEVVEGYVHGTVTWPLRGRTGFGFDPMFVANEYPDRTYGEMDPVLKNNTNHRADAFKKLLARCF
jgi:XTP/dITP diphosphohydrolase